MALAGQHRDVCHRYLVGSHREGRPRDDGSRHQAISLGKRSQGLRQTVVGLEASPTAQQKGGQFLVRTERSEKFTGRHFRIADRLWPFAIIIVIEIVHVSIRRAFDVESFAAAIPAAKKVRLGPDEFHGIAKPPTNRDVHHRHRRARAAVVAADHAVQEQVLGIGKVDVAYSSDVVMDAAVLL